MTVKRFLTLPALLGAVLAVSLLLSPAVGNSGEKVNEHPDDGPSLWAELSWTEGIARAHVEGIPGTPVELRVTIIAYTTTGTSTSQTSLMGAYDVNGEFVVNVPLSMFLPWTEFDMIIDAVSVGFAGNAQVSDTWGLRKRVFDPNSPFAPVAPAGGAGAVAAPGTQAPLLPYTWASMNYQSTVVLFQCAPTGIEGVIPVN